MAVDDSLLSLSSLLPSTAVLPRASTTGLTTFIPPSFDLEQCPGFCGRTYVNGSHSECGACPWGMRSQSHQFCNQCSDLLSPLDWLYLLFLAALPLLLHVHHVHRCTPERNARWTEWVEWGSALVECTLAAVASVLVYPPRGELALVGCGRGGIREWYPWMVDPRLKHARSMHCSYEVVFPLFSLPFVYLLFCLLNTLILRPILYVVLLRKHRPAHAFYASLFSLPLLALANSLLAGILYSSFAYLSGIYALAAHAIHLSFLRPHSRSALVKRILTNSKDAALVVLHSLVLAFSLLSLCVSLSVPLSPLSLPLLLLVPLPPLFFVASAALTHPLAVQGPH